MAPQSSSHQRRFPKSARLSDSKAFRRLLSGKRRLDNPLEMAFARNGGGGVRLGLVVSSKFLPRAVDRNVFKRIVREAFRQRRAELPEGDILIRLRQSLKGIATAEWRPQIVVAAGALLSSIRP
ncbi:MAG: ribonuclease P protein component [Casimicrobiaceae bacterium]